MAAVRADHDAAVEGELVELAPSLAITKGSVDSFTLPFTEPLVEDKCFLSIGYLFLSLLIQDAIYDSALQPIRDALLHEVEPDGSWSVKSYLVRSRPHEPWHGAGVEQSEPYFVLQVRLFGQHAWRVDLSRIGWRQELLVARTYRLDLASGEEAFVA